MAVADLRRNSYSVRYSLWRDLGIPSESRWRALEFRHTVDDGCLGKFLHHREPRTARLPVVRPNRDPLCSLAVFDLDAGPLTITLPAADNRLMSLQGDR